jgi:hypothetical protein
MTPRIRQLKISNTFLKIKLRHGEVDERRWRCSPASACTRRDGALPATRRRSAAERTAQRWPPGAAGRLLHGRQDQNGRRSHHRYVPGRLLVNPRTRQHHAGSTQPTCTCTAWSIWLDDLGLLISADGITDTALRRLAAAGNTIIGTLRAQVYDGYRPTDQIKPPEWNVITIDQELLYHRGTCCTFAARRDNAELLLPKKLAYGVRATGHPHAGRARAGRTAPSRRPGAGRRRTGTGSTRGPPNYALLRISSPGNSSTISTVLMLIVTTRASRSTMYLGLPTSRDQSLGSFTMPLAGSVLT